MQEHLICDDVATQEFGRFKKRAAKSLAIDKRWGATHTDYLWTDCHVHLIEEARMQKLGDEIPTRFNEECLDPLLFKD